MSDLIVASCPECLSEYRLQPDMAGKRMRCTNATCREVFTVPAAEPAAVTTAPASIPASESAQAVPKTSPPLFDWRDAPPPVQGELNSAPVAVIERPTSAPVRPLVAVAPPRRSTRKWLVAGLSVLVVVLIAWAGVSLARRFTETEGRLTAEADAAFAEGRYRAAADKFAALLEKYPNHVRADEFRFRGALAQTLLQVSLVPPDPRAALGALTQFLDEHGNSPFLPDRRQEVIEAGRQVLIDAAAEVDAALGRKPPDLASAGAGVRVARQTSAILERHAPAGADLSGTKVKLAEVVAKLETAQARAAARAEILSLLTKPRPELDLARELIGRAGFGNDTEITAAWTRAEETLRKLVVYREVQLAPVAAPPSRLGGWLPGAMGGAHPANCIPALVNGLLVGIDRQTGWPVWADRIGIDAGGPVVPLDNEMWLVAATDPPGLAAREAATGSVRWFQPLESPPVGPPALVNGRLYLALGGPTGVVLQIEPATGICVGRFETGQPLAGGIGIQRGSTRLFVPAAAQHVYVLETAADEGGGPRCVATIATQHAQGTLRGPPVLLNVGEGPLELLLTTTHGRGQTTFSLYRPAANGSLPAPDRIRLPGWSWWPPVVDAERLATVTDLGVVGLFGLRRPGSLDPPLYPLVDGEMRLLDAVIPTRAAVAGMNSDGIVVLSDGNLRQWRLGIDRVKGLQLKPGWSLPDPIGAAVQPPVVDEAGTLYLVTQRRDPAELVTTAVRIATGEIVWQHALGTSPSTQLVAMGNGMLSIDRRGAARFISRPERPLAGWQFGGEPVAGPVNGLVGSPIVVAMPGGVAVIHATAKGVRVRRIGTDRSVQETTANLPAPLDGTPGIANDGAVLPLANGQLVRMDWSGAIAPGPSWRLPGAPPGTTAHVVHWRDQTFLVADGHRRCVRLTWPAGTEFDLDLTKAVERPRRLFGPPVIIPGPEPRALIADVGGSVVLLRGPDMTVERTWKLGGDGRPLTAGPVHTGDRVLVALNHRDVVILSPDVEVPVGTFSVPSGAAIGVPTMFGDSWVVADTMGRIWRLDPATGRPRGQPYVLPASTAIQAPLSQGEMLLVVLADGSAVFLTQDQLAGAAP